MKSFAKVLLFEKFTDDPNVGDLVTLIEEERNHKQISDRKQKEIEEKLGVRSFDEFLKKFAPTIFPTISKVGDEINYQWTFDSRMASGKGIKLDQGYAPIKMLVSLLEKRKSSNQDILAFDWSDAFQAIQPKNIIENAKMIRKQFIYYNQKIEKLSPKDPSYQETARKIISIRKEIVSQYRDNPMNLLPLAIEDTNEQIELLEKSAIGYNGKNSDAPLQIGTTTFGDNGEIVFIPIENKAQEEKTMQEQITYGNMLALDYKRYKERKNEVENTFAKNLIVNVFAGGENRAIVTPENKEEVIETLKQQVSLYSKQLESSFKNLKEMFQKILSVKAFFDETPEDVKPLLIVANNNVSELAKGGKALNTYLHGLTSEKALKQNTGFGSDIWLAIVPGVKLSENKDSNDFEPVDNIEDFDIFADEDNDDMVSGETSIGNTRVVLDTLSRNKIVSFVSFYPTADTTFESMKQYGADKWEHMLEEANFTPSNFIVPCFPNYTLIDEKSSEYVVNAKLDQEKHFFHGTYIDASYVAAGLVCAYLEPKFLKEQGFKCNAKDETPGIRINLEDIAFGSKITTSMPKESSNGLITNTQEKLRELGVGFVTLCDSTKKKMFVYLCRTTNKEPMYKTFVKEYLRKYFFTQIQLNKSLQEIINKLSLDSKKSFANAMLTDKDTVELKDNVPTIYTGDGKPMPLDLDINVESNQDQ